MTIPLAKGIVNSLSDEIATAMLQHHREGHGPGFDADRSDDIMKRTQIRFQALRKLRQEFEDLMYGYDGPYL